MKYLRLKNPTVLTTHGQKWSMLSTRRRVREQKCARGGFGSLDLRQTGIGAALPGAACCACSSRATRARSAHSSGTVPGSVHTTCAYETNINATSVWRTQMCSALSSVPSR